MSDKKLGSTKTKLAKKWPSGGGRMISGIYSAVFASNNANLVGSGVAIFPLALMSKSVGTQVLLTTVNGESKKPIAWPSGRPRDGSTRTVD